MRAGLDSIQRVMVRDLRTLAAEIQAYENEDDIWRLVPGVNNSAGTLALHLAGNIQHYIGAVLGDTGYVRDRDAEFARRDVPRAELAAGIEAAIAAVQNCMPGIDPEQRDEPYPDKIMAVSQDLGALTTGMFLQHLVTHLNYHLGQVDYHRRVLTGGSAVDGAQSIPALLD